MLWDSDKFTESVAILIWGLGIGNSSQVSEEEAAVDSIGHLFTTKQQLRM